MSSNIKTLEQFYKEQDVDITSALSDLTVKNFTPHFLVKVARYCYVYGNIAIPTQITIPFDATHISSHPTKTSIPFVWKKDPNSSIQVWSEQGVWKDVDNNVCSAFMEHITSYCTNTV